MTNLITGWTIAVFVLYFINYLLIRFFKYLFVQNKDIIFQKAVEERKTYTDEENKAVFKIGPIKMILVSICPILNIIMCVFLFIMIFNEIIMIIALINTIKN